MAYVHHVAELHAPRSRRSFSCYIQTPPPELVRARPYRRAPGNAETFLPRAGFRVRSPCPQASRGPLTTFVSVSVQTPPLELVCARPVAARRGMQQQLSAIRARAVQRTFTMSPGLTQSADAACSQFRLPSRAISLHRIARVSNRASLLILIFIYRIQQMHSAPKRHFSNVPHPPKPTHSPRASRKLSYACCEARTMQGKCVATSAPRLLRRKVGYRQVSTSGKRPRVTFQRRRAATRTRRACSPGRLRVPCVVLRAQESVDVLAVAQSCFFG